MGGGGSAVGWHFFKIKKGWKSMVIVMAVFSCHTSFSHTLSFCPIPPQRHSQSPLSLSVDFAPASVVLSKARLGRQRRERSWLNACLCLSALQNPTAGGEGEAQARGSQGQRGGWRGFARAGQLPGLKGTSRARWGRPTSRAQRRQDGPQRRPPGNVSEKASM